MSKVYRFNVMLDSLRFLRSVFFTKYTDPYIQMPIHVRMRKTLFRWDSIAAETGQYQHNYPGYAPYCSSQPLFMEQLPKPYAQDAYAHAMQALPERITQITRLLTESGCVVDTTPESWRGIQRWLRSHLEASQEPKSLALVDINSSDNLPIRPLNYSFIFDLSLLLGEQVRGIDASYRWKFWPDAADKNSQGVSHGAWLVKSIDAGQELEGFSPWISLMGPSIGTYADKRDGKSPLPEGHGLEQLIKRFL